MRTVVEVDAQISAIREGIQVHQVPLQILDLLPFICELLLGERPVLPLGGFPITRGHGCRDLVGSAVSAVSE